MKELLHSPWPWYISGIAIALIMLSLNLAGRSFGISSTLRTICGAAGAGKVAAFFDFDHKSHYWNLLFAAAAMFGGFVAVNWMHGDNGVDLSLATQERLQAYSFRTPSRSLLPPELLELTVGNIGLLVGGGFLIGFGTRYAGGCTSGHAISGLSNLQLPSLVAVIGFFIGGLTMVHLIFPFLFS